MAYRKIVIGGEEFLVPSIGGKKVILVIIGVLALIFLSTSFYKVGPDEVGVIKRFGAYTRTTQSGLHMKIPFGVETVNTPKVRKRFTAEFGFRTVKAGVQSTVRKAGYQGESLMLTGDLNSVVVNWIVQYQIKDPIRYLFNVRNVEGTIRDISQVAMSQIAGDRSVDEILTFGRAEVNDVVQELMQEILDSYGLGIQIVAVNLQDVDPPPSVKPAFDEVNAAIQDMDRKIQEARREYNEVVPKAQGESEMKVKEAQAYAIERINRAKGESAKFIALFEEYRKAKDVTRRRLYLETLNEILPKIEKKWLLDEGSGGILKLLDLQKGKIEGGEK